MNIDKPRPSPLQRRGSRSLQRSVIATALFAAGLFLTPSAALAQPSSADSATKARDPAAAEALYKRGRELLNAGNWAEACAKFDASMSLNPAASTMLNIASCHEHDGRLSEALMDYKRALQLNQDTLGDGRKKALEGVAQKGIDSLEPRLAKIRITIKDAPSGLLVKRDGKEIPLAMLGEEVPVDPGAHEISASAPGYQTETRSITLKEGGAEAIELSLSKGAATSGPAAQDPVEAPPASSAPDNSTSGSGGAPVWAWIAGGAGIALVGAGAAFRIDEASAEKALVDHCGEELLCDRSAGYDPAGDNARKNRDFALFIGLSAAGAVGIGAAIIGIVRGSSSKKATNSAVIVAPIATPTARGVALSGAF